MILRHSFETKQIKLFQKLQNRHFKFYITRFLFRLMNFEKKKSKRIRTKDNTTKINYTSIN